MAGPQKTLTLAETQAARVVAAVSDCSFRSLDPGGGARQLPDFELLGTRQKRLGVLEVTSTVVGELAAFEAAQARYRIAHDELRFNWYLVSRSASASLKQYEQTLPPLLIAAENRGLVPRMPTVLEPGFNFRAGEEPETSLSEQGIWMICALPTTPGHPARVYVKPPAQGGAVGPRLVTEAVQRELGREDNLAKLRTAAVGERAELFVWLAQGSAGMALVTPRLFPQYASSYPTDGPVLPEVVTRVWAATGPQDRDVLARALWVADGGIWRVLQSPPRLA
jgi:hypothetical protein